MSWVFYAITAAVLVSAAVMFEKKSLLREHAMQFSAVLAIVNVVVAFPFLIVADYSSLNLQIVIIMFFVSILGSLAFLFMAKSVRHLEISISAPLLALSPALTAFLGFILLGELLTLVQISGMGLIVFGSYVITINKNETFTHGVLKFFKFKYYRFILFSILLYSFASIADKFLLVTFDLEPMTYVAIMQIFIAFHLFVMISLIHRGYKDIFDGFKRARWLILFVSVCTVGYRVAQTEAIKQAPVGLVIAIKRMSALIVVALSGSLFHEKHVFKKLLATLIMILGVVLIVI